MGIPILGQGLPGSGKPKGMGLNDQLLSRALAAKASPADPRDPCWAPHQKKKRKGKKERKEGKRTRVRILHYNEKTRKAVERS